RLDRGRFILRSQWLPDWRAIARAARAQSANRPWGFVAPPRLANHPGLFRHPRRLCLFAVVAGVLRNVAALEICPFGAKHWSAWRHRLFSRLVACSRRPVLFSPAPDINSR